VLGEREVAQARELAEDEVARAVEFAEASPEPPLDTMYESLYAFTDYPGGWYAVDERSPEPHRGEHEAEMPERARELAEAGAAYADEEDERPRPNPAIQGDPVEGHAREADDEREAEERALNASEPGVIEGDT
jgi:hypothetical protein